MLLRLLGVIIVTVTGITGGAWTHTSPRCPFHRFQCKTGHCLNFLKYCDGIEDCPDGSDEVLDKDGCRNAHNNGTLKCKLPEKYHCDSYAHCVNKTDEKNCADPFRMTCDPQGRCNNQWFLNCSHRQDWNCSKKIICKGHICSRYAEISDKPGYRDVSSECGRMPTFSCDSGECLTPTQFCDGVRDCEDGSDEILANVSNVVDGITCSNKWNDVSLQCVLPSRFICDHIDHCDNRVDECQKGCNASFFCTNGKCLSKVLELDCDKFDDCGDGSDEQVHKEKKCYLHFTCANNETVSIEKFCDGRRDCEDGSDELKLSERKNSDMMACLPIESVVTKHCVLPNQNLCDDVEHCENNMDEAFCPQKKYIKCNNTDKAVNIHYRVCDHIDDCGDSFDECSAQHDCNNTFTCDNGQCIAFERFCDGNQDCDDGSDEVPATTDGEKCSNVHNEKTRECKLPERYICDGKDQCRNRMDECQQSCSHSFFCNDNKCIKREYFCDDYQDCKDNSDEETSTTGFKCHSKTVDKRCVLPQRYLFEDGIEDCQYGSDKCQEGKCFRCLVDEFYISHDQLCDGYFDCPDLSDECICLGQNNTQDLCNKFCTTSDHACPRKCSSTDFKCDEGTNCIPSNHVCNGITECDDDSDEKACGANMQMQSTEKNFSRSVCPDGRDKTGIRCDGVPDCPYGRDECETVTEDGKKSLVCGNDSLYMCKEMLKQNNLLFVTCPEKPFKQLTSELCNGIEDCERTSDDLLSLDERGCKNRWNCARSRPVELKKVTIHVRQVCDGKIDCDDEEDEDEELCKSARRFYCEDRGSNNTKNGKLFVPMSKVLDNKRDCWDNSDECPTKLFEENAFSSRHRMIKNAFLSVMVWIMGLLATIGNIVVVWHTSTKLRLQERRCSTVMRSNYIVVLNLAIADFLMGIYLLSLAIENTITNGSYCKYDREWRSSFSCSSLGVLAMVSLQASVCFLDLLTTYRTLSVLRPFSTDRLKAKNTLFYVAIIWILSLILAVLPRLHTFEDFFLSSVQIPPSGTQIFNKQIITREELSTFMKKLRSYATGVNDLPNQQALSWSEMRTNLTSSEDWLGVSITRSFGYYSSHSVCLPKIFVKTTDSAWAFSLSILIFDFLSFLYVVIAYAVMYKDASQHSHVQNDKRAADENKTLQGRITRLVLVDFFCIVPVCVIAFLSVAGVEIGMVAYSVAAIMLLPINSALNPLIYSNVIGVIFRGILQQLLFSDIFTCFENSKESSRYMPRRKSTQSSIKTTVMQLHTMQDTPDEQQLF